MLAWFRKYPQIWGSVVLVGGLVLGAFLWGTHRMKDADENGPGKIKHVTAVTFTDGRSGLLLSEAIEHSTQDSDWETWRLSALHISDGSLRARVIVPERIFCDAASPGLAWCVGAGYVGKDRTFELRSADSLAVTADEAKLRASGPDTASGIANDQARIDVESGTIYVMSKDGHSVAIDPKTLASKRAPAPSNKRLRLHGTTPSSEALNVGPKGEQIDLVAEEGGRRQRLVIGERRRPLGERSFLSPKVVARLADQKLIVVMHRTSLDEAQARIAITGLTEAGETKWNVEDANANLMLVAFAPEAGVLALVFEGRAYYVLGLDAKTGEQRYRYDGTRRKK